MKKWQYLVLFALAGMFANPPAALAQASRTWVSGVGDDANPCSRTAPCKTFAGAISKTAAGGEINALDPGGYGAVTITKSITINADHVEGGVVVSVTNAIVVNAGANDVVVLRGLDIEGLNTGLNGIRFLAGGSLHVQKCLIRNFNGVNNGNGIQFVPTTSSKLFVSDTSITRNGVNVQGNGIRIAPSGSGSAAVVIERTHLSDNQNGIRVDGTATSGDVNVSISDSIISGNRGNGIVNLGDAQVMVANSTASNNGAMGIRSTSAGAVTRIGNNTVTGNGTGLLADAGGQLLSYGNNRVNGNGTDGAPSATIAPK